MRGTATTLRVCIAILVIGFVGVSVSWAAPPIAFFYSPESRQNCRGDTCRFGFVVQTSGDVFQFTLNGEVEVGELIKVEPAPFTANYLCTSSDYPSRVSQSGNRFSIDTTDCGDVGGGGGQIEPGMTLVFIVEVARSSHIKVVLSNIRVDFIENNAIEQGYGSSIPLEYSE